MAANLMPHLTPAASAHPYLGRYHFAHAHHQPDLHTPHLRHLLCGYRSKVCNNPRARKRNGSLHRFCEDHRQRANVNQKRWASRRLHGASDSEITQLASRFSSYHDLLDSTANAGVDTGRAPQQSPPVEAAGSDAVKVEIRLLEWLHVVTPVVFSSTTAAVDSDSIWDALGLPETEIEEEIEYAF